jgi:uncharacterized membrane protein
MSQATRWQYRVAIGVGYLTGIAAYPRLPLTRYFLAGHSMSATPLIAFWLPTTSALIVLLVGAIWRRDPIRDRDEQVERTSDAIVFAVVVFLIATHLLVMGALTGAVPTKTWLARVTVVFFGLLIIRIGNLLPRTRPNLALGIRTPC